MYRYGKAVSWEKILLLWTLLMALAGCVAGQPMTLSPVIAPTPVVSEPVVSVPQPVNPGEQIGISIRVDSVAGVELAYEWSVLEGQGRILAGQGMNAITYEPPAEPGTYGIRVKVSTADTVIERSVFVIVREAQFPTPTSPISTSEESFGKPTIISTPEATALPRATDTPVPPTATSVLPTTLPKTDTLPNGEVVSPESLARLMGGEATYWTKRGPVVWGYWDKGHNATFHHPGSNTILTYWAGFPEPRNADDCQIVIPEADNLTRYVKCPPGTIAEFEADGVGFHLIDYTGYFPR